MIRNGLFASGEGLGMILVVAEQRDMASKYNIQKLNGGWVVVMATNGHIMAQFFDTEEQAVSVRDQFERGERTIDKKPEVWVIGKSFVMEPYLGGCKSGKLKSST
jgi:hypothetical protein